MEFEGVELEKNYTLVKKVQIHVDSISKIELKLKANLLQSYFMIFQFEEHNFADHLFVVKYYCLKTTENKVLRAFFIGLEWDCNAVKL